MAAVINATPHALRLLVHDGDVVELPPSGAVPRVSVVREAVDPVQVSGVDVPVDEVRYGDVVGLPDPQPGVVYVVSALVAAATPHREDVLVPGELVRDEAGRVVGARGLSRPARA